MDEDIVERFERNIVRVESLISLYGPPLPGRRKVKDTDILRAALVLLHASMEDFLRYLLISKVNTFSPETLSKYSLPSQQKKGGSKFSLGELASYRGKSVEELIVLSVTDYLEKYTSFNNLGEVKMALIQCGIDKEIVNSHDFGNLPGMIERRHNIVHRADRNENVGGQGNHQVKSIGTKSLINYVEAVKALKIFIEENVN